MTTVLVLLGAKLFYNSFGSSGVLLSIQLEERQLQKNDVCYRQQVFRVFFFRLYSYKFFKIRRHGYLRLCE